ncbi:MAG: NUDIX domain-containing protein [Phycisphaerales bacterium]|nr:NUDIX domain-containing protein [Phycisphaerales bacterium]
MTADCTPPIAEQVALALVRRGDRWLVNRRLAPGPLFGLFEFPGGKVQHGETPADAARRECLEELAIHVRPIETWAAVTGGDHGKPIHLVPVLCELVVGEPRPNAPEIGEVRWMTIGGLFTLAMPAPNRSIVAAIAGRFAQNTPGTA